MRLYIDIPDEITKALFELAEREMREVRSQAILLIKQGLEKAGYLNPEVVHLENGD